MTNSYYGTLNGEVSLTACSTPPKQFYRFRLDLTFKVDTVSCRISPSKKPAWRRQQLPGLLFNQENGATYSSEMLGDFQRTIQRYIPKDRTLLDTVSCSVNFILLCISSLLIKKLLGTHISFRNVTSYSQLLPPEAHSSLGNSRSALQGMHRLLWDPSSLRCSQQPVTGPYHVPDKSVHILTHVFFKIQINIILECASKFTK
jgi:hypothetical protein